MRKNNIRVVNIKNNFNKSKKKYNRTVNKKTKKYRSSEWFFFFFTVFQKIKRENLLISFSNEYKEIFYPKAQNEIGKRKRSYLWQNTLHAENEQ